MHTGFKAFFCFIDFPNRIINFRPFSLLNLHLDVILWINYHFKISIFKPLLIIVKITIDSKTAAACWTRTRSYYKFPSCSNLSDDLLLCSTQQSMGKSFWAQGNFGNHHTRIMNPTTGSFRKSELQLGRLVGLPRRQTSSASSGSIFSFK